MHQIFYASPQINYMKNQNKLVSVILNCYNGEKYLKDSLKSIVKQTYKNWELIFWDNRSSDLSKTIMKSFKNKKFKYFSSKQTYKFICS